MTIVATRSGKVEGLEHDGIHVFRGIPYAAPPVGKRRWSAPEREPSWDGVRDATKFSMQSAQTEFALTKLLGGKQPANGEDSLSLNVWTPACDDGDRPVLVWIHGGAFVWGAGDTPWYDGSNFARRGDVVVVTINYRLGPFGFLHLGDLFPELEGSGNAGILDQVAALDWVRDCIAAFGGDPTNVTIFGESAGAGSVGTLLGLPAARGLFHKAIPQSGAAAWWSTRERAHGIAMRVVERLGVRAGDLDALLAKSTSDVIAAMPSFREDGIGLLPFQPVVDGTALPESPLAAIAQGNAAGVPVLTGTNRHEMTMFQIADPRIAELDDVGVVAFARHWLGDDAGPLVASYRSRRPAASPQELWQDLATDRVFRVPAIQLAEAQSAHASTWMYLFTWETPAWGGILRSTHALEVPFVFDNLDRGGAEMFLGRGPGRQQLADTMHRTWIAFAHSGDPNARPWAPPDLPAWPRYSPDRRATMRLDEELEVLDDPDGADREALAAALGRSA
jgi:para-nitrobenzyl esterase